MELREEIAFFQAVKSVIAKATETDKKLSQDRKNAVLKQILDNAVVTGGVEDIFKLAGLERPDIGLYPMLSWKRSASCRNTISPSNFFRNCSTARSNHAAELT